MLNAPLGIIASPDHFTVPERISLQEAAAYPLIFHSPDTSIWHVLNKNAAGAALIDRSITVATNLATVLAFVSEGVGVSIMSALGASAFPATGLSFHPFSDEGLNRSVYLFSRSAAPLSKAAQVVRDAVVSGRYSDKLNKLVSWSQAGTML